MVEVFEKRNIVKFQKKYQDPDGDMITCMSFFFLQFDVFQTNIFFSSTIKIGS